MTGPLVRAGHWPADKPWPDDVPRPEVQAAAEGSGSEPASPEEDAA